MKETLNVLRLATNVQDEDIFLMFKRYNTLQDGMLTYEDLRQMISPLYYQTPFPTPSQEGDQAIVDDDCLMSDLALLFEALFSNLKASECIREKITKRLTFDKRDAFAYCDMDGDGEISVADIKKVLLENNAPQSANEKEIMLIVNKFKLSSVRRGGAAINSGFTTKATITIEEYLEEITPKIEFDGSILA